MKINRIMANADDVTLSPMRQQIRNWKEANRKKQMKIRIYYGENIFANPFCNQFFYVFLVHRLHSFSPCRCSHFHSSWNHLCSITRRRSFHCCFYRWKNQPKSYFVLSLAFWKCSRIVRDLPNAVHFDFILFVVSGHVRYIVSFTLNWTGNLTWRRPR